jgi:hypothetical protein
MSDQRPPLSSQAAHRLVLDTEPYLSCDDCFALVDTYVEALLVDPTYDHPAMRVHLSGCVACAEEARSLVELAAADAGIDPTPVLGMLAG